MHLHGRASPAIRQSERYTVSARVYRARSPGSRETEIGLLRLIWRHSSFSLHALVRSKKSPGRHFSVQVVNQTISLLVITVPAVRVRTGQNCTQMKELMCN